MARQRTLIAYLCNAIDESTRLQRHIVTDSPAATNKVLGVADAIRLVGLSCLVLSLGRGRQNGSRHWYSARTRRDKGVALIYCPFLHFPFLTHFVTALGLLTVVIRLAIRHPDMILLSYNRAYHYVPALMVARLLGVRSCLDLEDGFILEGRGRLRRLKNSFTRKLFACLCPDGAMVANSNLAHQLDKAPALVCHGVASRVNSLRPDWEHNRLHILFCGTLLEEVGCKLLIDAIDILKRQHPEMAQQLHFVVTGKGPCVAIFREMAYREPEWLSFSESLPRAKYVEAICNSHVGLSLRLAKYEMGATTFPSKVIEYAEYGLLVFSTRVGDVQLLFGDDALYLDEETPTELAKMLVALPAKRIALRDTAFRGQEKVLSNCSPYTIGREIRLKLFKIGYGH